MAISENSIFKGADKGLNCATPSAEIYAQVDKDSGEIFLRDLERSIHHLHMCSLSRFSVLSGDEFALFEKK